MLTSSHADRTRYSGIGVASGAPSSTLGRWSMAVSSCGGQRAGITGEDQWVDRLNYRLQVTRGNRDSE